MVADAGCYLCLMHMQGEPRTMQVEPDLRRRRLRREALPRAAARVRRRGGRARGARLPRSGHRLREDGRAQPRARCGGSTSSRAIGRPLLVGLSRKSTLGKLTGDPAATTGSAAASVGGAVAAFDRGATILRVHDVREHVEALAVGEGGGRMIVELAGLHVFGYHGVEEEEQRLGQLFLFDVAAGGRATAAPRTASRMPSTTRRSRARSVSSRARSASTCSRRSPRTPPTCCSSASRRSACVSACASRRSSRPG